MKNATIKQLADQRITISLMDCGYVVMKDGESIDNQSFGSFNDALEFAGKQIVIGETMVGFNESGDITIDDAIRHLEMMDEEYDIDSYTEDVIKMVVKHLKGSIFIDNVVEDKEYPLPSLCYGDCGKVYENRHLNHIDDPNGDEVLLFCNQCAFQFVARLHEKDDSPTMDEIRESCGEPNVGGVAVSEGQDGSIRDANGKIACDECGSFVDERGNISLVDGSCTTHPNCKSTDGAFNCEDRWLCGDCESEMDGELS